MSDPTPLSTDDRLIKSYVWHGEQCYFVSTINRDSSAIDGPSRYAETMVWEFDWAKQERGALVMQDEGPQHSIVAHLKLCACLFSGGSDD